MTPIEKRFKEEKKAAIWSDWCSSGVWDGHGVCVPADWLPVSGYAQSLINAMQTVYDWQESQEEVVYGDVHCDLYQELRDRAAAQVKLELPDWDV